MLMKASIEDGYALNPFGDLLPPGPTQQPLHSRPNSQPPLLSSSSSSAENDPLLPTHTTEGDIAIGTRGSRSELYAMSHAIEAAIPSGPRTLSDAVFGMHMPQEGPLLYSTPRLFRVLWFLLLVCLVQVLIIMYLLGKKTL